MSATTSEKRNDNTRLALIRAGLLLFGEHGFKATSTRMLSQESGANISAIPYYFGGKEGLYTAVIEHIAEQINLTVGPVYAKIEAELNNGESDDSRAKEHLKTILDALAHLFVESEDAKSWALLILKEQLKPTTAYDIIYNNVMKHVHEVLSALIAQLSGGKRDDPITIARAQSLMGQVLIFLSGRETLLRRMGVKKLQPAHITMIKGMLWQQTLACYDLKS